MRGALIAHNYLSSIAGNRFANRCIQNSAYDTNDVPLANKSFVR